MKTYMEMVPLFRAMADETRLQILDMLSGGESCACKLLACFDFKQPTLSYHMKILTESGLVSGVRDGTWMRYSLVPGKMQEVQAFLTDLYVPKEMALFDAPRSRKSS